MGKTNYMLPDDKPEIEINKTTKTKFWQRPDFNLMLYVLMMLVSYYLWQDYVAPSSSEYPALWIRWVEIAR